MNDNAEAGTIETIDAEGQEVPVAGRSCRCRVKTAHYIADVCLRYRQVPTIFPMLTLPVPYMYMSL